MFAVKNNSEAEIIEKKSKFITRLFKVLNEEEIKKILKEIIIKEKGAAHNCYAYRLIEKNNLIERKNDDGEPGGTAGAPMLAVLTGEDLINVLAVTTRYFGGVKLGTGGLVNVYKRGVQEAIKVSGKIIYEIENDYSLVIKINQVNNAEYQLGKKNIKIVNKEFGTDVIFKLLLSETKLDHLKKIAGDLQAKIIKK